MLSYEGTSSVICDFPVLKVENEFDVMITFKLRLAQEGRKGETLFSFSHKSPWGWFH